MTLDDITLDLFDTPTDSGARQPPTADSHSDTAGDEGRLLHEFAEQAYLAYAMSVVKGRALPSIEDGQKPVQRRILYAMREMGNRHDAPFKKSARIVGDVIGKYHPHGDSSVYDAAVRLAQDFTLRYPLIEGQGNFGSRDGDAAAAMRYTEIRLSRFAEDVLLSELDRGTVEFRDNYDGSMREPALLPARLPVLLLNGASGIAVGMATDMPPHNLREIASACAALADNPAIFDGELLGMIAGPDFPGGAQIISGAEEIRRIYASGRGSLRVRARWTVEPLARGQYRIAVTELPPDTSSAKVLAEIESLTNPVVRPNKKALDPSQIELKNAVLSVLETARDDSDKAHPVRLLIEPRSSRISPDELMAVLLAHTSLEANVSLNMVSIGRDGRPGQKGLAAILREWISYRLDTVERRLAHRLTEVEKRLHILDGRMIAFLNIEEVIRVIRESDEPKSDLMARFALSSEQAEDILEIRLRQLARLEGIKIEREIAELRAEADGLRKLLASEGARRALVAEEIRSDAEKHGDARRTLIEAAEKVTASRVETAADEPVTILLSRNGFIRSRTGHGIDRQSLAWKSGDGEMAIIETRTVNPIVLLDSHGRAYTARSADIPGGKGDGVPVTSLIDLQNSRIVAILSAPAVQRVLIASTGGYGFLCNIGDMTSRQKAGKAFVTLDAGQGVMLGIVPEEATRLAALSDNGRLLVFDLADMKELSGGGKGVIIMGLDDGEKLLAAQAFADRVVVWGTGRGDKPLAFELAGAELEHFVGRRARKGRLVPGRFKKMEGLRE